MEHGSQKVEMLFLFVLQQKTQKQKHRKQNKGETMHFRCGARFGVNATQRCEVWKAAMEVNFKMDTWGNAKGGVPCLKPAVDAWKEMG